MKCKYCQSEMVLDYKNTVYWSETPHIEIHKCKCGAEYNYDESMGLDCEQWLNSNGEPENGIELNQCRFCKHFDPHIGYYGSVAMCHQFIYNNSIYCNMSHTDSCSKFELCNEIKKKKDKESDEKCSRTPFALAEG